MSSDKTVILYDRFRVPGTPDTGVMLAWDTVLNVKAIAYAGPIGRAKYQSDVVAARTIRQEVTEASGGSGKIEIFTTPGWLWLIAPDQRTAEPALRKLRQAGLLPAAPEPARAPANRCPGCGNSVENPGQLCAACLLGRGGPANPVVTPTKKKISGRTLFGILFVLLLIAIAVVGVIALLINRPAASTTTGTPPPTVSFVADSLHVERGHSVRLSWDSSYATSITLNHGIGGVSLTGSRIVAPAAPTTYTLTASGPGGVQTRQLTVSVVEPEPAAPVIIEFSADRAAIREGESVRLTWATSGAASATIEPDVGAAEPSGSASVAPRSSTEFTLTATGPGGVIQKHILVNVARLEPTATLTVNGQSNITIAYGDSVHLCWTTANARRVDINGTAEGPLTGCVDFRPQSSDSFQLHASGDSGNATASVHVSVQPRAVSPPPPQQLPPPQQPPPRPVLPASGDILWYGKTGFFGHQTANIYLRWYPQGDSGRWYSMTGSDGRLNGSIPSQDFRLSWSLDNEPMSPPRVFRGDSSRPIRMSFSFRRGGDHVIRFHWERLP